MSLPIVIQGATRGIGLALCRRLLERGEHVIATGRSATSSAALEALAAAVGERLLRVSMDITDEASIAAAASLISARFDALGGLFNVSGLLHDAHVQPEKKLDQLEADALHRVFAVNAFGPALVLKHLRRLLQHRDRAVVANVSARVGSISDNRLGGWYAYRASKAAQNMMTRTAAIELGRGSRPVIVIAVHPGTVETDLSAPFRRNVPAERLFTVERAADQLLSIFDGATIADSGQFFAWDGSRIEW